MALIDPNTTCRFCGVRLSQHDPKKCDGRRFAPSGQVKDKPKTKIDYHGVDWGMIEDVWKDMLTRPVMRPAVTYKGLAQYIRPKDPPTVEEELREKIASLERTMQTLMKRDNFDLVYHRAAQGPIDYTEWVDEEDCLTDVTRGGMRVPPKKRIIF